MKNSGVEKDSKLKYFVLHLGLLLLSFSGVFSKYAANEVFLSFRFFLFYGGMLAILFVYALLWQQILKRMKLTTAYYNKAITIVWGVLWGKLFFDEDITMNMVIGGIIVFIGIYFVISSDVDDGNKKEMRSS
jgi:drug/metabolite transporter (DMT)-like permease